MRKIWKVIRKNLLLIIGILVASYFILKPLNEFGIKKIGTINISQYYSSIENGNIKKIYVPEDSSSLLVVETKDKLTTIEEVETKKERERYEEEKDLTFIEKNVYKRFGWYPSQEKVDNLPLIFNTNKYNVLVDNIVYDQLIPVEKIVAKGIEVDVISKSFGTRLLEFSLGLIRLFITIAVVLWIFVTLSEKSGLISEANSKATDRIPNVKLDDVAGIKPELKLEITEIIDFIKNKQVYVDAGIKTPKGILMTGLPGVGKTMLAKAIANEANVPFYYRSASDFENPYVGMSAKTVKYLFEKAKEEDGQAIIFIDELDSFGSRGKSLNNHKDSLINALLTAMDGFEEADNIIVIGATNNPEKIDSALLREGRFDRKLNIPLPDLTGREEILKVHCRNKKLADNVDLHEIARLTIEYSGAELANIVNEAGVLAIRDKSDVITQEHFIQARDKKIMGVAIKDTKQTEEQRKNTAYHEAGHAVLSYFLDKSNELYKVSILPRSNSLGVTVSLPIIETLNYSKEDLLNRVQILFGGRIAERLFLNSITTGASHDIEQASNILRRMVKEFGMSDELGMIKLPNKSYAGNEEIIVSQKTLEKADETIDKLLKDCYNKAEKLLKEKYDYVEALSMLLLEKEEVNKDEIIELFQNLEKNKHGSLKTFLSNLPFRKKDKGGKEDKDQEREKILDKSDEESSMIITSPVTSKKGKKEKEPNEEVKILNYT